MLGSEQAAAGEDVVEELRADVDVRGELCLSEVVIFQKIPEHGGGAVGERDLVFHEWGQTTRGPIRFSFGKQNFRIIVAPQVLEVGEIEGADHGCATFFRGEKMHVVIDGASARAADLGVGESR